MCLWLRNSFLLTTLETRVFPSRKICSSKYLPVKFKFIKENDGYFPVKIESLPEGSVVYPHVPVYVITAEKEYSKLVTYLETILTMVWYPSTVATLSRRCKEVIRAAFIETVDPENYFLLESRLHDFGFRGCTSNEQAVLGGTAHLVHFIFVILVEFLWN